MAETIGVGVVLAHGSGHDMKDPLLEAVHRGLTERKYLALRFNFPFAESGRPRPDPLPVLEREPCKGCWARHVCGGDCYHRAFTAGRGYTGSESVAIHSQGAPVGEAVDRERTRGTIGPS